MNASIARALMIAGLAAVSTARAEGLHVVRRLPGYQCIGVEIVGDQPMASFNILPPVHEAPSADSPSIAGAQAAMLAVSPLRVVNGFVEVVLPNHRHGWVAQRLVESWHSVSLPRSRCYAAVMSDGSWAFDYDMGQ